jgi:hypothetical protein
MRCGAYARAIQLVSLGDDRRLGETEANLRGKGVWDGWMGKSPS